MASIEKDSRFSKVYTDPRFLPMPTYEKKVKIDKRFNAMFKSEHFGHRSIVDKRGRPIHDNSKKNKTVMQRFYEISSSDESSEESSDENADDSDCSANQDKEISTELKAKGTDIIRIKGKQDLDNKLKEDDDNDDDNDTYEEDSDDEDKEESSDESSSSDDEQASDVSDHEMEETGVADKWNELHTDAPSVSESTCRLAVCNMDWDFVTAHDLYMLFNSFAGEGNSIGSVTIYPSEFGKERMAEEALLGPREMRESLQQQDAEAQSTKESSSVRKKNNKKQRQRPVDQQKQKRMEQQVVKAEQEVLRNHQINRLRYYYAVVDCGSVEVADNIYKECDGMEYQLSSVQIDLRYIPEDMTFEDEPRESFTEAESSVEYTPKLFHSTALSQAKVEVTWDETEFDRLQKRMKFVQGKELEDIVEENRHADIIAPPESDSDLDTDERPQWLKNALGEGSDEEELTEERKIELYRKVLMDKIVEEEESEKKDNEVNKEMEFQAGLKSAVESNLKKSEKSQGSLVDQYLEKKKEKKKKKREQKKEDKSVTPLDGVEIDKDDDEVPDIIDDDLKEMMESEGVAVNGLTDKKKQQRDKKKRKRKREEEEDLGDEKEAAELELLLMGDEGDVGMKKTEKVAEGKKLSRRQKKKLALKARDTKREEEEVIVNVEDPRFGAMFSSHHFHIDPSAPEFKKTTNMMKLLDEQIKRKPKGKKMKTATNELESNAPEEENSRSVSKKLLESLKRKMKKK